MIVPIILLAVTSAGAVPVGATPVPLAYAQARDAHGNAVHERQTVTVTGVATTRADGRTSPLKVYIEDRSGAPYGLSLYSSRIQTAVEPGDLITATGRLKTYASSIELVPDTLSIGGHSAPPQPVAVKPEELIGWRWSGVLVRTRAAVDSVEREEDHAEIALATGRGPLHVHIAAAQLKTFDLNSIVKGESLEITGVASAFRRRTAAAPDFEILPRQTGDVKIVRRSMLALATTIGVSVIALLLIGAAIVFSRPQKIRPEQYP